MFSKQAGKANKNVECFRDLCYSYQYLVYLTALRRTETAGFTIRESHTLDALAELNEIDCDALLLPYNASKSLRQNLIAAFKI